MNITIRPAPLAGTLRVPSSKSMTHREIIAAALAKGEISKPRCVSCPSLAQPLRKKRERMA